LRVLFTEATTQETTIMGVLATNRIGRLQDRKTGHSEMPNRTIRFPQRQQHPLVSSTSSGCLKVYLLLMDQGAIKIRQGRGAGLWSMTKQSTTWRKVQRRLQQSRTRPKVRRQISELRQWPVPSSSQTGQSGLINWTIRFLKDQYRRGFRRVRGPGQHRLLVGVL
jgi:hypothetical protein